MIHCSQGEGKQMSSKSMDIHDDMSGVRQVGESILRRAVHAEHTSVQITPYEKHSLINFYDNKQLCEPITIPHGLHKQVISYFKKLINKDTAATRNDDNSVCKTCIDNESYTLEIEVSSTQFGDATLIRIAPEESRPALESTL